MKLDKRIEISIGLRNNQSLREIGRNIDVNHTTVLREINKNRVLLKNPKAIVLKHQTNEEMLDLHPCQLLQKSPSVCNGCPRFISKSCTYNYVVYDPNVAENNYTIRKTESNSKMTDMNKLIIKDIQKGLDLGQPITHIYAYLSEKYKEDMVSKTTIYNWIDRGILIFNKKKIKRKNDDSKKENAEYKNRTDFLKEKEYKDFLEYKKTNDVEVCEMDLLCGPVGSEGYLMTLFIPRLQFLLIYKLKNKTPFEVVRVFDEIENKIGFKNFKKLFGVILTDRGSEFLKYNIIEYSKKVLKQRTKIFNCDAGTPTQKPNIENIHRLVRRVYPKGTSFENETQEDLYELASNINSLKKEKYNNKTPNEIFIENYNKTVLNKLSLRVYDSAKVVLKPTYK